MTPRQARLEDLESAATGLLVLDREWRILWASRSLEPLAAIPRDRWHGSKLWGVFPRLRGNREARVLRSTMADGVHRTFRLEYRDEHAGGVFDIGVSASTRETLLLEIHDVSALLDASGQLGADADAALLRALAREFREAASASARLLAETEAASRARTSFLATVSHELRTPLTALAGYGELLADGILGDLTTAQEDAVDRMRAVTTQLTSIIDRILEYSDLESGNQAVHLAPADACFVAREVASVVGPMAERKHIAFELDVPDMEVPFMSDAAMVQQIVLNLAENAVKFTDTGVVTLRVRWDNGCLNFVVEDTGPGIAAEDQPRLFQPFTQLSNGLTRSHGGTGLGLYVSSRLARLLGARIEVSSLEGEGSAFELSIPLDSDGD